VIRLVTNPLQPGGQWNPVGSRTGRLRVDSRPQDGFPRRAGQGS